MLNKILKSVSAVLFATSCLYTTAIFAACNVAVSGQKAVQINILSNSFPSVNYFAEEMKSCANDKLTVQARLTKDHLELKKLALKSKGKASYQIMQVSTSNFNEFVAKGQLTPLTSFVKKYSSQYNFDDIPQPLWDAVSYKGDIYAIPVQQNLQHFFYRQDLFDQNGLAAPKSYADVVAAAKVMRGKVKYPITYAFGKGWNLATEFTNIYMSLGGKWFDGNLNPVFHTDGKGEEALAVLAELLEYASPNALSHSSDDAMVAFQQGISAMGNLWATRAGNMDDASVSQVVGKVSFSPAPTAGSSRVPSSTVWWDGYIIPTNVAKKDHDLAFQVIAEATDQESMLNGGSLAFFSRETVTTNPQLVAQNRYWPAMLDTIKGGAPAYPSSPYFNLAHTAIGANVVDALAGQISPLQALQRAATEYTQEAKAKGFI